MLSVRNIFDEATLRFFARFSNSQCTDHVSATVVEATDSAVDANRLGTNVLQLSGGARAFADLELQGDVGTHFRLRFKTVSGGQPKVRPLDCSQWTCD